MLSRVIVAKHVLHVSVCVAAAGQVSSLETEKKILEVFQNRNTRSRERARFQTKELLSVRGAVIGDKQLLMVC